MANAPLESNVWLIDTASTATIDSGKKFIRKMRWVKPASIDDSVVVKDGKGNIIGHMNCGVAKQDVEIDFGYCPYHMQNSGISVPTLASGTLYIYFE
jgi:hypothetical protein